jgi:glycosyltransferase involved in cell wall biosynthesis
MMAFFTISTHLGGAEQSLLDLVKLMRSHGTEFHVVVPKKSGPLIDKLNKEEIPVKVLTIPPWILQLSRKKPLALILYALLMPLFVVTYLNQLGRHIKEHDIHLLHSTGLKLHLLLGLYACLNSKVKLVIHLRDLIDSSLLRYLFYCYSLAGNIQWISNSQATAQSLMPVTSEVIYNGFPRADDTPLDFVQLKDQWQIPHNKALIGIVGVIARWKGQREFIEMAAHLKQQGHDFHYLVIGDEIYDTLSEKGELQYLQHMVQRSNLKEDFHFLGFQSPIAPYLRMLDALVHASIRPEPFGRVVVEAMIYGCPVTASDQGGPTEIIKPGSNGLLHEMGNSLSMAQNVLTLLQNPTKTQLMVDTALKNSQIYSMETHFQKMLAALK